MVKGKGMLAWNSLDRPEPAAGIPLKLTEKHRQHRRTHSDNSLICGMCRTRGGRRKHAGFFAPYFSQRPKLLSQFLGVGGNGCIYYSHQTLLDRTSGSITIA